MTILLVRHGETALNVTRVLQPPDTPLGERGRHQAAAVARRVAALAPAALLASDLPRAWQTAQALADASALPIEASPLLHERNFGDWRGRAWTDVDADPFTLQEAPPGGESMAAFEQRVAAAWAQVQARRAQLAGPLVVITHGLLIHRLLSAHAALAPGTVLPRQLDNASLTVLDAAPPHAMTLMGCTRHLDDLPPTVHPAQPR